MIDNLFTDAIAVAAAATATDTVAAAATATDSVVAAAAATGSDAWMKYTRY